ncbi:MAG: hypothetical protein CVU18_09970 [Betaproteobacteria bacterium HGW-Betaproteobacteria-12]|nr:MAG: hypothetical protein CVU18_09970 [Betaproteobacteria bacterium HGW-Betaproteobacteria-12]
MKHPAAGFTLIEILVAMSLLAVIGVLGYRGLDSVRQTAERVQEKAMRWQEIALVVDRLGSDVRQALAVPGRWPDGSPAPAWQTPAPAELVLSRATADDGDLQRLAYRALGDRLELLTWPAFDASAPTRQHVLLAGLAGVEFAYLDREQRWLADWPSAEARRLPRALRLRLHLAEGGVIERIFDVAAAD